MSGWREPVLRLFRVPAEPDPPPGGETRIFRAAYNYFYFRLLLWFAGNIMLVISVIGADLALTGMLEDRAPRLAVTLFRIVALGGLLLLLVRLTLGYALVRLDYELRWYMISDRAIRIREGVMTVREKTIALANIQNTTIRQGPLQRLFGIADVEVRTAGGGSGSEQEQKASGEEPMHVGYFRGVDNAAQLRQIIMEGVRRHRDAGLGDPDDHVSGQNPVLLVLEEARALRKALMPR